MEIKETRSYLPAYFERIKKMGIDLSKYKLDHIGFSTISSTQYDEEKANLLEIASLVREHLVSNRRVGVFRMKTPLVYENFEVEAIELVEPKEGESPVEGFEHTEFTIDMPFREFIQMYPNLPWDTSSMDRSDFPRLKLVFEDKTELKLNLTPILEEA